MGNKKTLTSRRGFADRCWARILSRAPIRSPRKGEFFRRQAVARIRDHDARTMQRVLPVNNACMIDPSEQGLQKKSRAREEPGFRFGHVRPTQSPSKRDN